MLSKGRVQVDDIILYKRKNVIVEWEVNNISPSEIYVEIENNDHFARWIVYTDILEIIESEGDISNPEEEEEVIVVPEKPVVKATTADYAKT